jgi:hypothetical protein
MYSDHPVVGLHLENLLLTYVDMNFFFRFGMGNTQNISHTPCMNRAQVIVCRSG